MNWIKIEFALFYTEPLITNLTVYGMYEKTSTARGQNHQDFLKSEMNSCFGAQETSVHTGNAVQLICSYLIRKPILFSQDGKSISTQARYDHHDSKLNTVGPRDPDASFKNRVTI